MNGGFRAGDTILERHVFDGEVTIARPVTVVECVDEHLITWLSPGTEVAFPLERVPPYTGTTMRRWRPPGLLQLVRAGDPYALALLRNRRGRFVGWYVNLQEPLRWTNAGYETRDNLLDLFRPASGDWRWKDEDELAAAVTAGALTSEDATSIRVAAERAIRELTLPTGWEEWEPEPPLPALRLPSGWNAGR